MINLQNRLDDVKCYATVRQVRWPAGVRCPHGGAALITKQGRDTNQPARQKYRCEGCHRYVDDLTGPVLAGRHQPLRVWILCLYCMGLNLSNAPIAQELGLNPDDGRRMTEPLRHGIVARQPGFDEQPILLANSILDRISSEVVIEGESDVGVVDRLGVIPILDLRRIAMSLQPREIPPVPEETQRVARAAFPKGNLYVRLRDEIGTLFDDPLFAPWFPTRGQPAESPWRLALITVMPLVEGLSDRQAAEAVRARIDWKYALSLELTDPGGDASVLCEFRARLVDGDAGPLLLETMLLRLKEHGLLKARGQQRTDSTHVLAAIRTLNRLESVGETLRAAPNSVATVAPDWLTGVAAPEWFERYAIRVEEYRLPKGEAARTALGEPIGTDGHALLAAIDAPAAPAWLRELPAVQTLRQAWVHPFLIEDDVVRWRKAADLPPASTRFDSPYDTDARYSSQRSTTWTGYKVHVTETCDVDRPHLLVHVETTPAPVTDSDLTAPIQQALVDKGLAPATDLADAGYVDADLLVASQTQQGIERLGPVRSDVSWQAKAGQGFDLAAFVIDGESKKVICPTGQTRVDWTPARDPWGNDTIHVGFHRPTCAAGSRRPLCTRAKTDPREITLRPRPLHEALQNARSQQETKAWRARYGPRAGVEGTLSQAVRAFGLRRCRYIGLAKTQLQHVFTVIAMNVARVDAWLTERPWAKTRRSAFASLAPLAGAA